MQSQQPKTTLVLDVWYIIIAILCDVPAPEKIDDGERNKTPKSFAKEIPYLRDLISLSSTCSVFRSILAPRVFKRITLHNTAKSALAVQAIGQGKFAACVKELQYICTHTGSCRFILPIIYHLQAKHPLRGAQDDYRGIISTRTQPRLVEFRMLH
jgi:hypothetical protein